jgi:putative hydrolase
MSQEPFGDIPLFREIQRLLSSSEGPVNLEIARQVALAVATQGAQDPRPAPATTSSFDTAVHQCEGPLSGYTRLSVIEPVRSHVVGLAWWVTATLEGWRWLLDRLAGRFSGQLTGLEGEPEAGPLQAALGQVGPLLMGLQAGTLVGHLARDSLGRYDLPIPRDDDGRVFFVLANVDRAVADYGFDSEVFRRWLALHQVARHLVVSSVPWVHRYLKSLLTEVVDAVEIDASDLERRLVELQSQGMNALQEGLGASNVLPVVPTERHRRALERLHAFLALFEGYAVHAVRALAPEIVGDTARIDEGMARRDAAASTGRDLLSGLLGVSIDRDAESAGATFCAAVTRLKGPKFLNRVWDAPDNLPDTQELRDPFAWMERQSL